MAAKVKSVELLSSVYSESISHEKSKRGLGNRFHTAVVQLLNENPNADRDELVKLFRETCTEVENSLASDLLAEFGEDATPKDLGAWTQYKSNYKRALETVDRRDILKCNGPGQLNSKLNEVRKAIKEKEEGTASTDTPADNGGGKGGDVAASTESYEVSDEVHGFVTEALSTLAKLSPEDAADVARHFRDAAAKRFRTMGHAKKKFSGVTGGKNAA